MPSIDFQSEKRGFKLKKPTIIRAWIKSVLSQESKKLSAISYVFCTDAFLHAINLNYLNHNTLTDIITFDYSTEKGIEGEIYISVDRVEENAKLFKVSFEKELMRVIIHGALHLIGFKDKTPYQKRLMRKKEEACLSLLK